MTSLQLKYHEQLLYNLSQPAQSPLLLAPLSQRDGGWGLCEKDTAGTTTETVFETVEDPDYRAIIDFAGWDVTGKVYQNLITDLQSV